MTKGDIKPRAQLRPVLIFPYPPADLQHCFRDAVGIPDRAPTVSEVEELWKQDRIRLIVNKRCGERMQTWYSNCLTSHHPNRRHPNRRDPCGSNSTAAEAEAKLDGSSRPHRRYPHQGAQNQGAREQGGSQMLRLWWKWWQQQVGELL